MLALTLSALCVSVDAACLYLVTGRGGGWRRQVRLGQKTLGIFLEIPFMRSCQSENLCTVRYRYLPNLRKLQYELCLVFLGWRRMELPVTGPAGK
jgi:hypothetical protein